MTLSLGTVHKTERTMDKRHHGRPSYTSENKSPDHLKEPGLIPFERGSIHDLRKSDAMSNRSIGVKKQPEVEPNTIQSAK